ncbi:CHAD domain-containing protein [Mycobacterium sp. NPDC051804]|uniref:CYTH and CHAD domain-containing protein n=1 Tax=Mycobacterium sp. NPDC051804 TaxID=3364295 RepID=UPI0037B27437
MYEVVERELKWEVDEEFVLPTLDDIVEGADVSHTTLQLTSSYYDTADGDLGAHGVLLRRRDGDDDTGWQLKVPDTEGRVEIRTSPSETPPSELTEMLTGMRLGKPLVNIATIRTVRDRYRISEPKRNRVCVEVDVDQVRASVEDRLLAWREVEVELGPKTKAIPCELADRLARSGAKPSQYPSKLARAAHPDWSAPHGDTPAAAEAIAKYLDAQIDDVFAGDLGLRRGSDPIHDTRVAIRRLRSTLRVFGKLLEAENIAGVEDELKWFATLLGEVRDRQVQRRRFREALAELPPELVLGPVANRINNDLQSGQLQARQRVTEAMDSPRYLALLKTLQQWRVDPPIADGISLKALTKRAHRAERKADQRLVDGIESGDDVLLHRGRKAAKRARYAAELRRPLDASAKRTVKYYKQFQRVLGDHQDGAIAAETLLRLALIAGTTVGESGFTFGMLYAQEQHAAAEAKRKVIELLG